MTKVFYLSENMNVLKKPSELFFFFFFFLATLLIKGGNLDGSLNFGLHNKNEDSILKLQFSGL